MGRQALNWPAATSVPSMPHYEGDLRASQGARFAILASRWNPRITDALVAGARKTFAEHGIADEMVDVVRVPGAWELPLAAARIAGARPMPRSSRWVASSAATRGITNTSRTAVPTG
jgi:6,7-dimethyl-8-ribityllumazine synthase